MAIPDARSSARFAKSSPRRALGGCEALLDALRTKDLEIGGEERNPSDLTEIAATVSAAGDPTELPSDPLRRARSASESLRRALRRGQLVGCGRGVRPSQQRLVGRQIWTSGRTAERLVTPQRSVRRRRPPPDPWAKATLASVQLPQSPGMFAQEPVLDHAKVLPRCAPMPPSWPSPRGASRRHRRRRGRRVSASSSRMARVVAARISSSLGALQLDHVDVVAHREAPQQIGGFERGSSSPRGGTSPVSAHGRLRAAPGRRTAPRRISRSDFGRTVDAEHQRVPSGPLFVLGDPRTTTARPPWVGGNPVVLGRWLVVVAGSFAGRSAAVP